MTAKEFFGRCSGHDWYYDYSDDYSVYSRGKRAAVEIVSLSKTDPLFEKIFKAWYDHVWSGPAFNSERKPRPELADFGIE